ncbi:hypothetical protein LCGC14_1337740 [marine sediment metagenome]|uniref:FCP1 homology domain-containing protein n=1 Tax=marine sediment metagenome TaxID=412755 RepID=A0A0F9L0Y1_9ZZZZ
MKVFLDLDGVLVDFRRGVCEAFGRKDTSNNWTFWENWEGVTNRDVDAKCDIFFWNLLDWTPDGTGIEHAVREKFGEENIYLLTTPMPNVGSGTGKLRWIKRCMPWVYDRTIISYAPKHLFANPDTLLIDDKDQNIEEFQAAGGQGILVPRIWNKDSYLASQTLKVVKRCLEDYR